MARECCLRLQKPVKGGRRGGRAAVSHAWRCHDRRGLEVGDCRDWSVTCDGRRRRSGVATRARLVKDEEAEAMEANRSTTRVEPVAAFRFPLGLKEARIPEPISCSLVGDALVCHVTDSLTYPFVHIIVHLCCFPLDSSTTFFLLFPCCLAHPRSFCCMIPCCTMV